MSDLEKLLAPVSEENPSGEDISYDQKFLELDTLILGKPETQFSVAEEPDWKAIREVCIELFARSKNLRVATTSCLALLSLQGVGGFRDGLALIKGLLEKYWDTLYPKLDPEDGNDPLERVNIISSLSTPMGTFGDPLRFLARLRRTPLTDSPQMGRFSLADIAGEGAQAPGGEAAPAPSAGQIQAAFRDTKPDKIDACYAAIGESISLVKGIDDFLMRTVGSGKAPNMDALTGVLTEMQKSVAPYATQAAGATGEAGGAQESGGGGAGGAFSGAVRSRADVIRAIEQICKYYSTAEPASPVPLILGRARRLVDMDFMGIVTDLAPDALAHINMITGTGSQTSAPPAEPDSSS